jgi:hypothetical protein
MTFKFHFWKISLIYLLLVFSCIPENCQADEAAGDKDSLCLLKFLQMQKFQIYLPALLNLASQEMMVQRLLGNHIPLGPHSCRVHWGTQDREQGSSPLSAASQQAGRVQYWCVV